MLLLFVELLTVMINKVRSQRPARFSPWTNGPTTLRSTLRSVASNTSDRNLASAAVS